MNFARVFTSGLLRRGVLQPIPNIAKCSNAAKPPSFEITPTTTQKYFLVWTKKYKNIAEVPDLVPKTTLQKAKGIIRVRIANITMLISLVICLIISYNGKQAVKRGEGVTKINREFHRKYNEEHGGVVKKE